MNHNYKIIDKKKGLAACGIKDIPEEYKEVILKNGTRLRNLIFFYDKEKDLIVLNEKAENFQYYAEIIINLLSIEEKEVLNLYMKLQENVRNEFKNLFTILLAVKKIQSIKRERMLQCKGMR